LIFPPEVPAVTPARGPWLRCLSFLDFPPVITRLVFFFSPRRPGPPSSAPPCAVLGPAQKNPLSRFPPLPFPPTITGDDLRKKIAAFSPPRPGYLEPVSDCASGAVCNLVPGAFPIKLRTPFLFSNFSSADPTRFSHSELGFAFQRLGPNVIPAWKGMRLLFSPPQGFPSLARVNAGRFVSEHLFPLRIYFLFLISTCYCFGGPLDRFVF